MKGTDFRIDSRNVWLPVTLCGLLLFSGQLAQASTIISVNGPNDNSTQVTSLNQNIALGVGFSTSTGYTNVSIFLSFLDFSEVGQMDLSVFVTNQIGSGTPVANEEGSATPHITVPASPGSPPYTITQFLVLSGLTLSAGTHYLTFRGANFGGTDPRSISSPDRSVTVVTNGASINQPFLSSGSPNSYVPASAFVNLSGTNLWFKVTGDAQVPEPSTVIMALSGISLLIGFRLRAHRLLPGAK